MNVFMRHGSPRVFIAHGCQDSQLPLDASARPDALQLLQQGGLTLLPFDGDHVIDVVVAQAMAFYLGPHDPRVPGAPARHETGNMRRPARGRGIAGVERAMGIEPTS